MKLPPLYLGYVKYGEAHSEKSEFSLRARYVSFNSGKLDAKQKIEIMRACDLTKLECEELKILEELKSLRK